jgi:drug/metabolite transporter (DMT)-like permease
MHGERKRITDDDWSRVYLQHNVQFGENRHPSFKPCFFGMFYTFVLTLALTLFVFPRAIKSGFNFRPQLKTFLLIGFFYALMTIAHYQAITRIEVVYMISVKRLSLLFSVLYGGLIFHEENKANDWRAV